MQNESQCITCEHFIDNKKWGCKAFPYIPDEVVTNKVIHDHKIEGQKGNYLYSKGEPITP